MANEKNLTPFTVDKREVAVSNGKKGAIASAEAKRRKKSVSELAATLIHSTLSGKDADAVKKKFPELNTDDAIMAAALIAAQIKSAMDGNPRAFEIVMNLAREGEEREAKADAARKAALSSTYHIDLDDVPDVYHPAIRDIRGNKHREYVFDGGRGSAKSSTVGMIIPELLRNNHDIHALVCRKVGNTLKDSVYAKIKWAIRKQGLQDDFTFHKSPLEITYNPTGQKIYFRGADEPEKIKSISPEFGYIGVLWFEELDQYNGDEEIRNITQSAIRGGENAWVFKSFNPPKTVNSWANRYVQTPKDGRLVLHTTYHDVPEEWLGTPFLEEAEHLKAVNPSAYEHEYEGVPNGAGGAVFEYVEAREITDEEINRFDRIYQGVDFGWYPDQFAFLRTYYDAAHETIFLMDELYVNKQSNEQTGKWVLDKGYDDYTIICDSAEPKSVADYRNMGLPVKGAVKGAGSVEYGFKWLQRRKIVIDPKRTPNAYKEIISYEYARDKNDEVISGYPDGNDHAISALRYAYEPVFNRRGNSA